jgi:hypothetical protein
VRSSIGEHSKRRFLAYPYTYQILSVLPKLNQFFITLSDTIHVYTYANKDWQECCLFNIGQSRKGLVCV